jgi:large subunit ribosomal protein L10
MADKKEKVAELTERFTSSNTVILTEYRGLSVTKMKELRRAMVNDATYVVAKNTLLRIAAKKRRSHHFRRPAGWTISPGIRSR